MKICYKKIGIIKKWNIKDIINKLNLTPSYVNDAKGYKVYKFRSKLTEWYAYKYRNSYFAFTKLDVEGDLDSILENELKQIVYELFDRKVDELNNLRDYEKQVLKKYLRNSYLVKSLLDRLRRKVYDNFDNVVYEMIIPRVIDGKSLENKRVRREIAKNIIRKYQRIVDMHLNTLKNVDSNFINNIREYPTRKSEKYAALGSAFALICLSTKLLWMLPFGVLATIAGFIADEYYNKYKFKKLEREYFGII